MTIYPLKKFNPDLIRGFLSLLCISLSACGGPDKTRQVPEISSITTQKGGAEGPVTGRTAVTIRGRNFSNDAIVRFGDQLAAAVFVPDTETIIASTAPVFLSGPVSLKITTGQQVVKKKEAFLFTPMIAFSSDRDGDFDLYRMETDGSGIRPLTINSLRDPLDPASLIFDGRPQFSPDGRQILFESNRTGDFEIFSMNRDGANQTNLTEHPEASDFSAAFSPDGTKIVFVSDRISPFNQEGDFEIFVMDQDGENVTQLTKNTVDDRDPVFSLDGTQVLFSSTRNGSFEIFFMDLGGEDVSLTQVTQNRGNTRNPVFSPDGSQILFSSDRDGDFELFVMDRNNGILQQLTSNNANDSQAVFLPAVQGRKIVFTSDRTGRGNSEIFEMSCNGSETRFVTSCDASTITRLTLHADADIEPSPSP